MITDRLRVEAHQALDLLIELTSDDPSWRRIEAALSALDGALAREDAGAFRSALRALDLEANRVRNRHGEGGVAAGDDPSKAPKSIGRQSRDRAHELQERLLPATDRSSDHASDDRRP
ncbi:hypothetical protein FAIPA1_160008 [Frankia sp. AiPs1]|uniref:CATRA system-associated protein n=1 Tax=Frankia sp. AiPa1 TaxID=573492 RepID=UPI00202B9523|nr:CATRA system-associated protein [Frankia sp. AiPa1]MCL9759119.1 hypothetical protein [Frankia sp. AiPa1]